MLETEAKKINKTHVQTLYPSICSDGVFYQLLIRSNYIYVFNIHNMQQELTIWNLNPICPHQANNNSCPYLLSTGFVTAN